MKRKAQVTIYLIGLMATIVVFAFIMINVGKVAKDKTYADNAADGGALAAASVMAAAFNYNAAANDGDEPGGLRYENDKFHRSVLYRSNAGIYNFSEYMRNINIILSIFNLPLEEDLSYREDNTAHNEEYNTRLLKSNRDRYQKVQQHNLENMMNRTHSPQPGDCDYYSLALAAGYRYNFLNAGISHRLGRINSKRFSQFLDNIKCGTVQNGVPLTFFWVDGAGRAHTVTAIVEIAPANNYLVNVDQATRAQLDANDKNAITNFRSAQHTNILAAKNYRLGQLIPLLAPIFEAIGDRLSAIAKNLFFSGEKTVWDSVNGLLNSQDIVFSKPSELKPYVINYVEDIIHPQVVMSMNFQFHMGGPVKGMRGDVDVPTFYPPVQSGSIASFNCYGTGRISARTGKTSASFDACIIAPW